ncbi:MAG: hypothetical protein IPJ68_02735 [Candidatus Moraniibacteriota bacterium]|nr:MAG: hypothetical protein IPJ68_02735 [Candidatus Moranbacteria bacterium]
MLTPIERFGYLVMADPMIAGLVLAIVISVLSILFFLFFRYWKRNWLSKLQVALLSFVLSGTVAVPLLYSLASCVGYCGF